MNKKGVTVLGVIFALIFLLTASIYFIKPVSAPYSESDFLTLEENTDECLINCYALIKIKNPTPSSITLSSNDFTKWYVKAPGAQDLADFHLEIEKNNSRIVPVYQTTCNPYDITNPNQSISHYDNCTTIQTGTNTEYYTTFEPWNPGGFTLEANKQYRIKIVGTKSIAKKGNNIDWKIRLQTPQGTFEPDWDWWNTTWQYKACLNISNQDNETMLSNFTVNFSLDTTTLMAAGKLKADCSDLRVVYNNVTELDRVTSNNTFIAPGVSCNRTNETFFFQTVSSISAASSDTTNYCMYYGNPNTGSAPGNKSRVWLVYEDCNRPNSANIGNGWVTIANSSGPVTINISDNECVNPSGNTAIGFNFSDSNMNIPEWRLHSTFSVTQTGQNLVHIDNSAGEIIGYGQAVYKSSYAYEREWTTGGRLKIKAGATVPKLTNQNYATLAERTNITIIHTDAEFYAFNKSGLIPWDTTDEQNNSLTQFNGVHIFFNSNGDKLDNLLFERALSTPPFVKIGPEQTQNIAPNITQITLTPVGAITTDNLNCTINTLDLEQTSLFVNIAWYKNSTLQFNFTNQPITNGTLTSFILHNANTTKNENWSCSATISDGTVWSGTNFSQGIIIQNAPPSIPSLLFPSNNTGTSFNNSLPNFNWTNSTDPDSDPLTYTLMLDDNLTFESNEYLNSAIAETPNITQVISPDGPNLTVNKRVYYWRVRASDGTNSSSFSETRVFMHANWTVTFYLIDSSNGRFISTTVGGCAGGAATCTFRISCVEGGYTNNNQPAEANLTAINKFPPGQVTCTISNLNGDDGSGIKKLYFDKTFNFTALSDNTNVNVSMSKAEGLTEEEHNWLQTLYDCLINKNCDVYNLLKNINTTVTDIWKHELRTDRAVVTNEQFNSRNLSSTLNISINYTINIPFKAGYAQGDLLPLRMFFWFHNGSTCYSQDKTTSNRAEAPFCIPLVAETLGPNNGTVTFTADLRPNLASGTYNITRSIEIDPIFDNKPVWINYGQEIIGDINVQESTSNQPSIDINQKSLKYPEIKSYFGAITDGAKDLLSNNITSSLIALGMILMSITIIITVVFTSYFRHKYK